jgi:isoamylase
MVVSNIRASRAPVTAPYNLQGKSSPLGATPSAVGTNFSLYSRHATGVELLFFDRVDDARPARVARFDPVARLSAG